MKKLALLLLLLSVTSVFAFGNCETIRNKDVSDMVGAGLPARVIILKIRVSRNDFDLSTSGLIALRKRGTPGEVIEAMIGSDGVEPACKPKTAPRTASPVLETDSNKLNESVAGDAQKNSPAEAPDKALTIERARTIAFFKSSLHPSRQSLEKALLKRMDWKELGLSIVRLRDEADLYVEIGYVSLSWITHKYSYRVFDRRSGVVIVAGETTSWGSLSKNLASSITKNLQKEFKAAGRIN